MRPILAVKYYNFFEDLFCYLNSGKIAFSSGITPTTSTMVVPSSSTVSTPQSTGNVD